MIEIPQKATKKALQILPRSSKYFDNARQSFLVGQAIEDEGLPKRVEWEVKMLENMIIQSQKLLKDDEFVKYDELESFLFKVKQNELSLLMNLGDSSEKVAELVKKLQEYDPKSETLTIYEARDLVKRSGMLLFPGWETNSSFLLDHMRR